MWDRIKKLWQKDPSASQQAPLLSEEEQRQMLDQTNEALRQGQYDSAQHLALQLAGSHFDDIAINGQRFLGLVHFHQQQYAQAWPIFESLALRTHSVSDWFNVVTSATLAGAIAQGTSAFEKAIKAHEESLDTPGLSVASMHLYYACALRDQNAFAQAFEHVQILRALYEKLPQTDARLLDLRNFPRLDAVLDLMADVLAQSGDIPEAQEWLLAFGSNLKGTPPADIDRAIERMLSQAPATPPESAEEPEPSVPAALTTPRDRKIPLPVELREDKDPRLD
ncbi:hypothetical protein E9531_03400 [Lampropedia puyangensis]|uniref:Tetratricopeptide repeat protein n=1 Tax=Lampropedia puyangensis TaxID=1330072 RepID=A0A4S8FAC1_9BURK|nr:hypothetical protein [Lampropedia puyangensis]THU04450.1 hypothetical protein E9531_03400 [Lampropedia puyangensis]